MRPLGLRSRMTVVLAVGATLTLAALTGAFNLLLRSNLDADADRVLRSAAQSGLETVEVAPDGRVVRLLEPARAADSGSQIWVYDGKRALERPPEPAPLQRLADDLAGRNDVFDESIALDTRLYALAIPGDGGSQVGTVVAALSIEPYERSAKKALIASLAFAGIVLLGVVLAGRVLVGRALRPVSRMTSEATDWSEHDLDHRFAVGEPYDEITGLAAAFDSMLDRLASSLRHEQRLSAEISHELRTPLAAIVAETELALGDGGGPAEQRLALERIGEQALQLQRILDTLLAAARAEIEPTRSRSDAVAVATEFVASAQPLAKLHGVSLSLAGPSAAAFVDVEAELLERMLAPLIENGCRYGSSRVEVTVEGVRDRVFVRVSDDGPGLSEEERERVFDAGVRGSAGEREGAGGGAGLGLALTRRLARAAGGEVVAVSGRGGPGALLELRLPPA